MKRAIVVRFKRVEEMIAPAKVAESAFVGAKQVRNTIPSSEVQFGR
jgi:hypothetical protein